ncbi:hypothetical protein J6E39_05985 [bacterium]|nr:hypothetical protein [bacterium]
MKIEQNQTLWGIAKQSVQKQTGEQKVTNQQIVDEMKSIAKQNGYEDGDFEKCSKEKFYGKLGDLKVKGLEVEHAEDGSEVPDDGVEDGAVPEESGAVPEDGTEDGQALKYTTLGGAATAGTKFGLKIGEAIIRDKNVKNLTKKASAKVAEGSKKAATKLKGKVDAAKVQHARNAKAAKIKDARNAAVTAKKVKTDLKAEEAKLKSLKANKASAAKIAEQEKRVAKAKANSAKATAAMKAKRKAAGLNQTTGQPLKRKIVKTPKGQVAKAGAKKAAKTATKTAAKTAAKSTAKTTAKAAAKATGKTLLKKIPGVGLLAGIAFAVDRAAHGDYTGAAMEVGSGAASCIPGVGTALSVGVDAYIMARDMKKGA